MATTARRLRAALIAASALTAAPVFSQDHQHHPGAQPVVAEPVEVTLEDGFRNPPNAARPRVWWHWMNGNVTKDGIAKDMDWMQRVGIGGLQNFDADLMTPQIVDKRLVYMTPEWKDAFRFTASEATRRGLELAIAASPGWSETGGPWVKPEDGLKKVVWSEASIVGGKKFTGKLPSPPDTTGPFLGIEPVGGIEEMMGVSSGKKEQKPKLYGDIAVLAFPEPMAGPLPKPVARDGAGTALDANLLADADLAKGVALPVTGNGDYVALELDYGKPVTVRSARMFAPGISVMFFGRIFDAHLESADATGNWRAITDFAPSAVPTTASFEPVTASKFRLRFSRANVAAAATSLGGSAPGLAMGDIASGFAGLAKKPLAVGTFELFPEARVEDGEAKAGFHVLQDYFASAGKSGAAAGTVPASVIDLTQRMKPDGTLDWTPPKGKWRVLRLGWSLLGTTNHPAPPEATGLEVDKFDGAAVERYLDHYIGMYKDASGGLLGKDGVRAILTDSIEVGAANWTPKMIDQFKRLRGYDPVPWLPALAGVLVGTREQSDAFLYDYRRTLADLMASEHYGTVARVARANGLKVYGEALEDHRPSLGDDMSMRSHADVPMAAMWTHTREAGPKLTYVADIKGAASVAHIYGQNLVAAESMTAAMNPWNYAPNDLRRIIDLEFVTGVNRPVIHTSVHQPRDDKFPGLSLFIFGQYFNRHESWAEMAKPWVDYLSRTSYMLQAGRNYADVGYFYGEEGPLTGLYGDKPVSDAPKTRAYDFVNFDALNSALRNDGSELATPGGARYKALYLGGSSSKMTLAALRRLAALTEGGATIVGLKPEASPSLSGDSAEYAALVARLWPGGAQAQVGKGRVIASNDIEAALDSIGVAADFRISGAQDGAEIPFVHRKLSDGESYFLVNRKNRAEAFTAHFRVTGKVPELWNAETGTSMPVSYRIDNGETVVPIELAAEKSIFVVFRKTAAAQSVTVTAPVFAPAVTLGGPWTVRFQPGRAAPAETVLPQLASLSTHGDPAIKYFSGEATYSKEFAAPKGWRPGMAVRLNLGEVNELAEVTINGKPAGAVWQAPYVLDIGPALAKGRNRIEVKVANRWVNRLIGDAQPGAQKITWTSMPTYRADAELRPSGLVGPVVIEVAK